MKIITLWGDLIDISAIEEPLVLQYPISHDIDASRKANLQQPQQHERCRGPCRPNVELDSVSLRHAQENGPPILSTRMMVQGNDVQTPT